MANAEFDKLFEDQKLRVTADAPAQNYLVAFEGEEELKQSVKEFFTMLGEEVIKDTATKTKWRRKVAEL